jgi:hypothetical protein
MNLAVAVRTHLYDVPEDVAIFSDNPMDVAGNTVVPADGAWTGSEQRSKRVRHIPTEPNLLGVMDCSGRFPLEDDDPVLQALPSVAIHAQLGWVPLPPNLPGDQFPASGTGGTTGIRHVVLHVAGAALRSFWSRERRSARTAPRFLPETSEVAGTTGLTFSPGRVSAFTERRGRSGAGLVRHSSHLR